MRYLLKNGTVVSGEKSEQMDILIEGEKIAAVGRRGKTSVPGIY